MVAPLPEPGDLFEDRYRIDSLLGAGGFAHVYLATQQDLGRQVAIKLIKQLVTEKDGDQTALQRFIREAKLIARLRDPHTISLHDYGQTAEGLPYMVTEFVSGESLDVTLRREGAVSADRVIAIVRQTLSSLEEAHAIGVLHRDIKPANILIYEHLRKKDQVKVLDFGIAKPMDATDEVTKADLTQSGFIVGTPRYMAPEYLMGKEVTPAADIYSLGLVAYELLTGRKAIDGNTSMTIIANQVSAETVQLPEDLDIADRERAIINRMLAKRREDRFQSAEEVLDAFNNWKQPDGSAPKTSESGPRPTDSLPHAGDPTEQLHSDEFLMEDIAAADIEAVDVEPETGSRRTRSAVPAVVAVIMLVLVGGGVGAWFVQSQPEPSADSSAQDESVEKTAPASPDPASPDPAQPPPAEPKVATDEAKLVAPSSNTGARGPKDDTPSEEPTKAAAAEPADNSDRPSSTPKKAVAPEREPAKAPAVREPAVREPVAKQPAAKEDAAKENAAKEDVATQRPQPKEVVQQAAKPEPEKPAGEEQPSESDGDSSGAASFPGLDL